MGLLDGGLANVFGAAFGAVYLPATLHRYTQPELDDGGSPVDGSGGWTNIACRAQRDAATERMRRAEGFSESDVRLLVLAASFSGGISTDDEVTVAGTRYAIESVDMDPAGAYWELRGRRG